jgi:Tol biopolymer transport system component
VLSIATREMQELTSPPASSGVDLAPAVSPDGRLLAFRRGPQLLVADIAGDRKSVTPPRLVAPSPFGTGALAWMPDGKEIVFAAGSDLLRVDMSGHPPEPVPLVGQHAFMPVVSRPAAGNSIRLVYVQMISDPNIWRLELPAAGAATSAAPTIFSPSTRLDASPQFSPDGRRVAFQSLRSGSREIWVADADGGNLMRLTHWGRGAAGSPRWSPDGELIAFDANVDGGQWDIYTIPARGGTPHRVTFAQVEDSIPSFSEDGKFLYFTSERTGTFQIWKTPVSGGDATATQVTLDGGAVALESPSRQHLYYTKERSGTSSLWRMALPSGVPERVVEGVASRAFQVLDHGIYYLERDTTSVLPGMGALAGVGALRSDEGARLQFFDFSDGKSRTLAHLKGPVEIGLAVSRDGRKVAYTQVDDISSDLMMLENFR